MDETLSEMINWGSWQHIMNGTNRMAMSYLDEGFLLQHIRDSMQSNWGDLRLGSSLASVQG